MIKFWKRIGPWTASIVFLGYMAFLHWDAPARAQNFQADNALSVFSYIVASNSATPTQICGAGCRIYQVDAFNTATTLAFVKLYNQAAAPTCGAGTPQWRGMIPFGSSSSGGGFGLPWVNGDSYSLGAWACVTGGIDDASSTTVSGNTYLLNFHFKKVAP